MESVLECVKMAAEKIAEVGAGKHHNKVMFDVYRTKENQIKAKAVVKSKRDPKIDVILEAHGIKTKIHDVL